jgi:hypothetical protein
VPDDALRLELDAATPTQDSRARASRKRNAFRPHPVPTEPMGKTPRAWSVESDLTQSVPPELAPFIEWFEGGDESRERFRWALRDSVDEVLDGQRTGRWAYQHLSKTEKTYLGTAVEVNLTKEYEIPNGQDLDWSVADSDIDCKFSKDLGGWEIPMEMYLCPDHGDRQGAADHPALLTWLNDDANQWAVGIITVTDERLRWKKQSTGGARVRAYNRDNKRRIADGSMRDVYWLWGGLQTDLPRNLLLHLDPASRERIFSAPARRGDQAGQARTNQLFREVQERIVGRQTVLTVAQQDDAPKRARDARKQLRSEGILVLGHQDSHPHIAGALGLLVPVKGEWIAVRVVPVGPTDPRPFFRLNGERWAKAHPDEPVVPAPELPKKLSP